MKRRSIKIISGRAFWNYRGKNRRREKGGNKTGDALRPRIPDVFLRLDCIPRDVAAE